MLPRVSGLDPGGMGRIFYNSENNIPYIRPFGRPLFCHSSVEKYTSSLLQQWTRNEPECQKLLKSPPPLNLLAGSAPARVTIFNNACSLCLYLEHWFSTWRSRPLEGSWTIFGWVTIKHYVYTAALRLLCSIVGCGSLGHSWLLQWVAGAAQKRLKTTAVWKIDPQDVARVPLVLREQLPGHMQS